MVDFLHLNTRNQLADTEKYWKEKSQKKSILNILDLMIKKLN